MVNEIRMTDIAIIFATLLGPILAVQAQKLVERWRDEKERRERIFKVLMATRGSRLSPNHIEALNMINIEFPAKPKFKKVRSAWKAYFSHLSDPTPRDTNQYPVFFAKRSELFTDLLYEIGSALGYDSDKTEISKESYTPIYHEQVENELNIIRGKLVDLLSGKLSLPMSLKEFPSDDQMVANQAEYLKLATEFLRGKPIAVSIVSPDGGLKAVPSRMPDPPDYGTKTG